MHKVQPATRRHHSVAHNPRRNRSHAQLPPVTKDQIAEAIERAVAIRQRGNRHPDRVSGQAMDPHDAQRMTDQWCLRAHGPARLGPSPWLWVGWVAVSAGWDVSTAIECHRSHAT
jgi:hypothetical protein